MTSASFRLAGLTTSLPCTKVRPRDAVAHCGGAFEFQRFGRVFHLRREFLLHTAGFAGEKGLRLADEFRVIVCVDAADARAPSTA